MKKTFIKIILLFFVFIVLNQQIMAGFRNIEGWEWIESKYRIELWQKEEDEYISEVLVNTTIPLGSEIIRGYTIKLSKDENILEYPSASYALGIWKVIFNGIDNSDNIYLKIFREKEQVSNQDFSEIKDEIQRVSAFKGNEKNLIETRIELFKTLLDNYIEKEGETFVIDSSRILVIYSLNDIPTIKIELNDKHTVINARVEDLE
ncbi:MAG: hypothetical protein ACOC2J_02220 [bacterium]